MRPRAVLLLLGIIALVGCYHATVDTGVAPSDVVIQKRWASGWVFGLVPPSVTATAAQCPSGVAKVETRLSFLNQVVSFFTMSIYTPMEIRVTCAVGVEPAAVAMTIPESASSEDWQAALAAAADRSAEVEGPVYLRSIR